VCIIVFTGPPTPQQQTHAGPGLQSSDGQVNLGLQHSQQAQQILVSQAYTQVTLLKLLLGEWAVLFYLTYN